MNSVAEKIGTSVAVRIGQLLNPSEPEGLAFATAASGNKTLLLKLPVGKSVTIDWGDGNDTTHDGNNATWVICTHSYAESGNYHITFTGDYTDITSIGVNWSGLSGDMSAWRVMTNLNYVDTRGNSFSFSSSEAWAGIDAQMLLGTNGFDADETANAVIAFGGGAFEHKDIYLDGNNANPTQSQALTDAEFMLSQNGNTIHYA